MEHSPLPVRRHPVGLWNHDLIHYIRSFPKPVVFMHPTQVPDHWFHAVLRQRLSDKQLRQIEHPYPALPDDFYSTKMNDTLMHVYRTYVSVHQPKIGLSASEACFVHAGMGLVNDIAESDQSSLEDLNWQVALTAALVLSYLPKIGHPQIVDYESAGLIPYSDCHSLVTLNNAVKKYGKSDFVEFSAQALIDQEQKSPAHVQYWQKQLVIDATERRVGDTFSDDCLVSGDDEPQHGSDGEHNLDT